MRIAALITARLKSRRLPRKALLPIKGRPMICHLIDRLRVAETPDEIVLCTSTVADDDLLAELAEKEGIACVRGSLDDVLQRLTDAASQCGVDVTFNCTADNPCTDPGYLDRLVRFLIEGGYDYAHTEGGGLPWGTFGWAVTHPAMLRACEMKAEEDTEVWGGYFTRTGRFKWAICEADEDVNWPDLRLTVDTPKDLEFVRRVFDELYEPGKVFVLKDIIDLYRRRPDLASINAEIQQAARRPVKLKDGASFEQPLPGEETT